VKRQAAGGWWVPGIRRVISGRREVSHEGAKALRGHEEEWAMGNGQWLIADCSLLIVDGGERV
jgi:hypothetical protein